MYLYTGNADQAMATIPKGALDQPNAFETYYNLGVAYAALNNTAQARSFTSADAQISLTDQNSKARVNDLLAKLAGGGAGNSGFSDIGRVRRRLQAVPAPPANSFEGRIEAMVRGLPLADQGGVSQVDFQRTRRRC